MLGPVIGRVVSGCLAAVAFWAQARVSGEFGKLKPRELLRFYGMVEGPLTMLSSSIRAISPVMPSYMEFVCSEEIIKPLARWLEAGSIAMFYGNAHDLLAYGSLMATGAILRSSLGAGWLVSEGALAMMEMFSSLTRASNFRWLLIDLSLGLGLAAAARSYRFKVRISIPPSHSKETVHEGSVIFPKPGYRIFEPLGHSLSRHSEAVKNALKDVSWTSAGISTSLRGLALPLFLTVLEFNFLMFPFRTLAWLTRANHVVLNGKRPGAETEREAFRLAARSTVLYIAALLGFSSLGIFRPLALSSATLGLWLFQISDQFWPLNYFRTRFEGQRQLSALEKESMIRAFYPGV